MRLSDRTACVCDYHGIASPITSWGWMALVSLVVVTARTMADVVTTLPTVTPFGNFVNNRSSIPQTDIRIYKIGFLPALTENKGRSKHFVGALKFGLNVSKNASYFRVSIRLQLFRIKKKLQTYLKTRVYVLSKIKTQHSRLYVFCLLLFFFSTRLLLLFCERLGLLISETKLIPCVKPSKYETLTSALELELYITIGNYMESEFDHRSDLFIGNL